MVVGGGGLNMEGISVVIWYNVPGGLGILTESRDIHYQEEGVGGGDNLMLLLLVLI